MPEGMARLTERELDVMSLQRYGKSYKEIGDILEISPRTVDEHHSNFISKLNSRANVLMNGASARPQRSRV